MAMAAHRLRNALRLPFPFCLQLLLASFGLLQSTVVVVVAVNPAASIDIYALDQFDYSIHASGASFGSLLPFGRPPDAEQLTLKVPPEDDPLLCNEADGTADYTTDGYPLTDEYGGGTSAILVPRGGCTFERKALSAQRLGASLVIVRNTLSSRYRLNDTASTETNSTGTTAEEPTYTYDDILWPKPKSDYDCASARAVLPASSFSFDPLPYDAMTNDALLTGTAESGNLCAAGFEEDGSSRSFESSCPSLRCLLTGRREEDGVDLDATEGGTLVTACCAWDLHMDMASDGSLTDEDDGQVVTIPALFVTMEQGSGLLETMQDFEGTVSVIAYERYYPIPNAASFLLWFLGVFVTWLASYLSAADYRKTRNRVLKAVGEGRAVFRGGGGSRRAAAGSAAAAGRSADVETGQPSTPQVIEATEEAVQDTTTARDDAEQQPLPRQNQRVVREEAFEDEPLDDDSPSDDDDNHNVVLDRPPLGDSIALRLPEESASTRDPPPVGFNAVPIAARGPPQRQEEEEEQPPPPPPQQQQNQQLPEDRTRQTSRPSPPPPQQQQQEPPPTVELNLYHVAGFLIFASAALFILFYFKIYRAVTVMYGIGCSGAMASIIFYPLYYRLARKVGALHIIQSSIFPKATTCGFNAITWLEVASVASAYSIGISWLYVFFTTPDPHTNAFYWITQDVMGAAVCIAFLGVIRLNSMKIATVLLVAVFVYDIFFVFITPLITEEGDSVMVTVATSGGAPADPDFCEKYPDEGDCRGGDPLPMLLTMPRVNDYRGGTSLLGLGDIVLPGLLISFAARLDSAKRLLRLCTDAYVAETRTRMMQRRGTGSTVATAVDDPPDPAPFASSNDGQDGSITSRCGRVRQFFCGGYYLTPLVIAYAIGLGCANLAVYLMEQGQPALLYLVPACLGTMSVLGWMRGELGELWAGSERIKKCDRIVASVQSSASDSPPDGPRRNETLGEGVDAASPAELS